MSEERPLGNWIEIYLGGFILLKEFVIVWIKSDLNDLLHQTLQLIVAYGCMIHNVINIYYTIRKKLSASEKVGW